VERGGKVRTFHIGEVTKAEIGAIVARRVSPD
jgi:hypothetical protein